MQAQNQNMYWNSYFKLPFKTLSLATQMHNFKMVKLSLTKGAAEKKNKIKKDSLTSDCNKLQVNRGKFKIFRLIKVQINVYKTKNLYFTQYDWQVFKHIL